ncbi:MAG: serine hydrolase domain-containing protein [Maribacter sp.]
MSSELLNQMDSSLHQIVDDGKLAGIQTAILRKGKLVHFDTYGLADIDNKKPLQENSIFRIFSMTKPIVSVALMQLYEQGEFQLDDAVSKYIPAFEKMKIYTDVERLVPAANTIKIVDLLRHTSGLGYGRGSNTHINNLYTDASLGNSENLSEFINKISKLPLYFEPGTNWQYSHSVEVCGYLVEVLSGMKLDEYLTKCILNPLKMNDTHFQIPEHKIERFTVGYWADEAGNLFISESASDNRYTREVTFFNGGGGLVSTTADYLRFCQMLLNKGTLAGEKILNRETVDLMTRDHLNNVRPHQKERLRLLPRETGFGLGFSVAAYEQNGERGVYGWGGAVGTYFRIDPKNELAYVMMIQISPYRQLQLREKFQTHVNKSLITLN